MPNYEPWHAEVWQQLRALEDLLATLSDIDDKRRVIRTQAWYEGNWDTVYQMATEMKEQIDALKLMLSQHWHKLHDSVNGGRL